MSASATVSSLRRRDAAQWPARVLAALVALHGVAHFAGATDALTKAGEGRSVEYLAGAWTLSDPTLLRAFAAVWALLGVAFIVAAAVTFTRRPAWPQVLAAVAAASLLLLSVALWSSVVGVVIDVALLALAWRAGALTHAGGRS